MRILPAPIYRYAERMPSGGNTESSISDGAIFGLFYDWDSEVFLILETRPTAEGPRWHYGVAYLDYKPLRLQHKGVDVWEKAEKNFGSAKSKYYCVIGVTTKPVELK